MCVLWPLPRLLASSSFNCTSLSMERVDLTFKGLLNLLWPFLSRINILLPNKEWVPSLLIVNRSNIPKCKAHTRLKGFVISFILFSSNQRNRI